MDMRMTRKILLDLLEQLGGGTGGFISVYRRGTPEPGVERMRRAEVVIPNEDSHGLIEGLEELLRISERYA